MQQNLPALYQQCNFDISPLDLAKIVKLCFADPNFPAFVAKVENIGGNGKRVNVHLLFMSQLRGSEFFVLQVSVSTPTSNFQKSLPA